MSIVVPPTPEIWQGDLFNDVPWGWVRELEYLTPVGDGRYNSAAAPAPEGRSFLAIKGGLSAGMLITHECVVDKGQQTPFLFARVALMSNVKSSNFSQNIRENRVHGIFYLPVSPQLPDESYVDLRIATCLDPSLISGLNKVASLTQVGREALREKLIRFWSGEPEDAPGTP